MGKEREQQASLALEDVELQKTALRTEADNRVKEVQLELEAARTVSVSLGARGNWLILMFSSRMNIFLVAWLYVSLPKVYHFWYHSLHFLNRYNFL